MLPKGQMVLQAALAVPGALGRFDQEQAPQLATKVSQHRRHNDTLQRIRFFRQASEKIVAVR
jgi:hypothetical protein